jgi:hypothetical protein
VCVSFFDNSLALLVRSKGDNILCINFFFSPTYAVLENSNSETAENMQELAVIACLLPV